ncbi:MAG: DNA repair protein RecO [Myxococcales bacterium]|nr:DNA repair protein RecO [Myxococcales bacterium]MCB9577571.1 DNA repair protein RecO [Polyangiaceae bacterium]
MGVTTTRALVLKRVAYGESDLVVTLLTEELGRVSALARGARASQKRFGGSLEPMHTLRVRLDDRPRAELSVLRESSIDVPRTRLAIDLDKMQAAGRALGWVRRAAPPRTPEPEAWEVLSEFLDRLDDANDTRSAGVHLTELGLRLLSAVGWGLDLERCVSCGKPCMEGKAAMVDEGRGGLVCRACGGARRRLPGAVRTRLLAATRGEAGAVTEADVPIALDLVERALKTHMGFE